MEEQVMSRKSLILCKLHLGYPRDTQEKMCGSRV